MQPKPNAQGAVPPGSPDSADRPAGQVDEDVVIPVVREEVQVGKTSVETGRVVVRVTPVTRTEQVAVETALETAAVERVPVNRVVTETQPPRQEGGVMIVPVYEEQVVVERRLVLKEEIRIRVDRRTEKETRPVELRSEQVEVTRAEPAAPKQNPG